MERIISNDNNNFWMKCKFYASIISAQLEQYQNVIDFWMQIGEEKLFHWKTLRLTNQ